MINKDEILDIVDENNNIIGQKPRREVHQKHLLHRVSHIWIVNSQKQILVQRRSLLKDTSPGKWEPFFGGHLNTGIDYVDGAVIELNEELGINAEAENLKLWKVYKKEIGDEFQGIFVYKWDGDAKSLKLEADEVDQVKWMNIKEVSGYVLNPEETNWSKMGYEKELIKFIMDLSLSPNFKLPIKLSVKNYLNNEDYYISPANESWEEDVDQITRICSQELIYNVLFKERLKGLPYISKNALEFIAWINEGWEKNEWFVFFIRNGEGKIIGAVDIKSDNLEEAEIGYWMSEKVKGVMTNAVLALTEIAKNAGYKSLYGLTVPDNEKSQNVLKRAGFTDQGLVNQKSKKYIKFLLKL
jgi:RimJ/RimL family protein N-acetyltransferase/isopentenyldiphosphate isomerase